MAVYEQHPLIGCVDAVLEAPVDLKISQQSGHSPNRLLGVLPITFGSYLPLMARVQNSAPTSANCENLGITLEQTSEFPKLGARM